MTYAVAPTVTAAASDLGWGSCPTTVAVAGAVAADRGNDCTVAKELWTPPPNTRTRPASTTPAASCVAVESAPAAVLVPPGTPRERTFAVVALPAVRPPRAVTLPAAALGTATSRLRGCASCHGRSPDSMAGGASDVASAASPWLGWVPLTLCAPVVDVVRPA